MKKICNKTQVIQKTVTDWPYIFADSSPSRGVSRMSLKSWQEVSPGQQDREYEWYFIK